MRSAESIPVARAPSADIAVARYESRAVSSSSVFRPQNPGCMIIGSRSWIQPCQAFVCPCGSIMSVPTGLLSDTTLPHQAAPVWFSLSHQLPQQIPCTRQVCGLGCLPEEHAHCFHYSQAVHLDAANIPKAMPHHGKTVGLQCRHESSIGAVEMRCARHVHSRFLKERLHIPGNQANQSSQFWQAAGR